MNYFEEEYDKLAETGTLDEVQTLHYTNKIILVSEFRACLLKSLLKINRKDEIMHWIFEIKLNKSMILFAGKGNLELVKFLIEKGANIHANNDDAVRVASFNGHFEVVKYLIEKGADIHANDDYALRNASDNGHFEVVKYLIEKGADIHANDGYALRNASYNGHIEVVKYLIENGADIHVENDYALRRASKRNHIKVANYLYSLDPKYYDEKYPKIVKKLKAN